MGSGTTMVAWLTVLTLGQNPADQDVAYVNVRDPKIPIILPQDPTLRAEIRQLQLWVSTDEGRTWRQEAVAAPEQEAFPFMAPADGLYWFNLSTSGQDGVRNPPDVGAVPPALKMVIDTRQPIVRLNMAERQGDQVSVGWELFDENLALFTLQLQYQTSEASTWYSVPISPPTRTGLKRWAVSSPGPIKVRVQVQDAAGNSGSAERDLFGGDTGGVKTVSSGFAPPPASPSAPASPVNQVKSGFPSHNWEGAGPGIRPVMPLNPEPPRAPVQPPQSYNPPPYVPPAGPADTGTRVIARSGPSVTGGGGAPFNPGPAPAGPRPNRQAPPVQFINDTHLELNYEISKVGHSGVGAVELWLSQDDGRTWRRFAEDTDLRPPFAVDLPGEGVYGFVLIVRSRAGLGKQSPLPGDPPELRLEVDTTAPAAVLLPPEADPSRKNQLTLVWQATDRNLISNPITLKWAEKPEGPWQLIAADLPNTTGRYSWAMPPNLPYRVYLRLEARDLAGNISFAETPEPVLVDLTEPEFKLLGVTPAGRRY